VPSGGQRIEYHNTNDVRWSSFVDLGVPKDGFLVPQTSLMQENVGYRAGRQYHDEWNAAPFGPAFPIPSRESNWISRTGDQVLVNAPLYADRAGHAGFSLTDTSRTALYRNGALVGESSASGYGQFDVPAGTANYRLEVADTRSVGDLATKVTAVWTFRSGHVGGTKFAGLPVSAVRFTPDLDVDGSARAGRSFDLPVTVQRQPGAPAGKVRKLTVDVSYDDGKTWHKAAVRDGVATVNHPGRPGYVSLRASATDTAGNTVTQTIIHAYRIR
jgi:hypothetical protein